MKHLVKHPNRGWLVYDKEHGQLDWVENRWQGSTLDVNELGAVLLALGNDRPFVAIIPWNKETPAWYDRPEIISFDLSNNQYDWLKDHIALMWDGIGNAYWFVDYEDRSYRPINAHPMGGFTLPYANDGDRYESVFMAASVMMSDKVELFKSITRCSLY
jgi:hypothetical protein